MKFTFSLPLVLTVIIMGFLGFSTYQRNKVWMSEINLWSDVCKKSWNKARPFDALGNAYEDNKMYDKAIEAYREAIRRYSALHM